jgi:hypothetical protein
MRRKSLLLALAICLLTGYFILVYYASNIESIPYAEDSYTKRTKALFESVRSRMEEIRGFEISIPLEIVDREWVLSKWGSQAVDEESLMDEEVFYKSLLLVPSDFRYEERKDEEVSSFMAFYWGKKIYVVRENFDPDRNSSGEALAHELEHAIQDMFNIRTDGTFDGDEASSAIVEGDAVLAGWVYSNKNISEVLNKTRNDIACENEPNKGYKSNLYNLFYFPYLYGGVYVGKRYLDGGYSLVDELLNNHPNSTEQIIHDKKEGFMDVRINSLEIRENTYNFTSFKIVKDERMGEFFLYIFLSTHLNDCEAFKSAEGWNGDNFVLLRKGDEFVFGWRIAFDTLRDADEFETSLVRLLEKVGKSKGERRWKVNFSCDEVFTYEREGKLISIYGFGKIGR